MKTQPFNPINIWKILLILSGLQVSFLFASNPSGTISEPGEEYCIICNKDLFALSMADISEDLEELIPATPSEATFEETITFSLVNLAPETPDQALFEDNPLDVKTEILLALAPVTPLEADFEY